VSAYLGVFRAVDPAQNLAARLFFVLRALKYSNYCITLKRMGGVGDFEWDDDKAAKNSRKHKGLRFEQAPNFDFESALVAEDLRGLTDPKFKYPERRFIAIGLLGGQVAVIVYSPYGRKRRIISLRYAEEEECELWLKGQ
jgi:uncharacterized DUF497 family protein